ncbi:MAG: hypothetical protein JWL89_474 [Candidatus Saccharibacteria bacterium]|nr:hypothetical protein [Candidatus Saccharibacteria bacterium]
MKQPACELMEGSPGIRVDELAHLLIPGRYRSEDGMGLHPISEQRVVTAADFYVDQYLGASSGIIVCSGYKNPGDNRAAMSWRDEEGNEYDGVPESYGMRASLLEKDIPAKNIRAEAKSVDTVTNFTNSQVFFPDARPVGIVAQEQHLERIMKVIAPRTMRRDYVGIVVPEVPGMPDTDAKIAELISRYVVHGLTPETQNSSEIAERRVMGVWAVVNTLKRGKNGTPHQR